VAVQSNPQAPRIPAAGAIIFDDHRRLLLIKRARPPAAGSWSVPGGKCEQGETPEAACIREVAEETGLLVETVRFAGRVLRQAPDGGVFVIDDFVCRVRGGLLVAGDDAAAAGWFRLAELAELQLAEGLYSSLREWDLLPA
jgi:ADP-ribose pyrophosphatase YjhB (NUDIX family)